MSAQEEELGPVDVMVIGYPKGAPMTGEAVPILVDLVERGIVRVLDVMFVHKDEDGSFEGFGATNLSDMGVGDMTVFEGASSEFWATTTCPRRRARSSRAKRPCCSCTRTAGPPRSPTRCGATAAC